MKRPYFILWLTGCLLLSVSQLSRGQSASQYPVADKIADKIIHDYQTSSCQQLAERKSSRLLPKKEKWNRRPSKRSRRIQTCESTSWTALQAP